MRKVIMCLIVTCVSVVAIQASPTIRYIGASSSQVYLSNSMYIQYPPAQVSGNGSSPIATFLLMALAYTANDGDTDMTINVEGWTLLGDCSFGSGYTSVYYKQWDSQPGWAVVNWSDVASDDIRAAGVVSSWSGVNSSSPVDNWGNASTSVGPWQAISSIDTNYANDALVGVWGGPNTGVYFGPVGGFMGIVQMGNFGGEPGRSLTVSYGYQLVSGPTGAKLAQSFDLLSGAPTQSNAGIILVALRE